MLVDCCFDNSFSLSFFWRGGGPNNCLNDDIPPLRPASFLNSCEVRGLLGADGVTPEFCLLWLLYFSRYVTAIEKWVLFHNLSLELTETKKWT